jgi:hypothetical protein
MRSRRKSNDLVAGIEEQTFRGDMFLASDQPGAVH